jgi:hypothetical protein
VRLVHWLALIVVIVVPSATWSCVASTFDLDEPDAPVMR